jgi:hypothetical protein
VVLGAFATWSCAVESPPSPLSIEDFKIGELYLEQSINDVIGFYGKPLKIGETLVYKGREDSNLWQHYYFEGFDLEVYEPSKEVVDIKVSSPRLKTPRSLCG